jgi:hypothetical protein
MHSAADRKHAKRTRMSFTTDEDDRLRTLVRKYGADNWTMISAKMPRRDRRQCRERWLNYLSPAVSNGPWTPDEEQLLRDKVSELGRRWKTIEAFFEGRTDINIKNHWKQMQKMDAELAREKTRVPPLDPFVMLAASWTQEKDDKKEGIGADNEEQEPLW